MKYALKTRVRSLTFMFVLLTVLGFSNGCSKDDPTEDTTNNPGANPNEVMMQGSSFTPATITVQAGTRITWRNNDSMTHTVTSDSGLFDSGNVSRGGSYSYTFNTPGTYPYHCSLHSGMTGTVIVN